MHAEQKYNIESTEADIYVCLIYYVINETLRLHNPVGALNRTTTKDYMMPETDLIIPKGVGVWINVMAIHFDENHYANPHDFNPDHFSKDAKAKRNP